MYVDSITTAAVVDELNSLVVGGRVQDTVEIDRQSVGLEIYAGRQRHYLLMTVNPRSARCHLVPDRLRRGVERPSPLGLLLRKYVEGARLMAVGQPPWERVLHLDFSGDSGETRLIIETMDNRSNILLTVEGDILDCIKRVGPDQNRYRVMLPGKPYVPPPPQNKVRPDQVTLAVLNEVLRQDPDRPVWRALVESFAGVSPLFAREVAYFASGDPEALAFDVGAGMVHAAFTQRIEAVQAGAWQPCVVPAEGGYMAFAAYPLTHLDGWQQVASISEAMTRYFGAPVGLDAYLAGKQPVRVQLDRALDRVQRKLNALERESAGAQQIEQLRKQGELILAYGPALEPGQSILQAQYDPDGPLFSIQIDPGLTHVENAQRYFERYEKAKRAFEDLPRLKEAARQELDYLQQLAADLDMAESWPEIEAVRDALQKSGYWQGQRLKGPRGGKPGMRRFSTEDGFVILVGRNAEQNHRLVTGLSDSADLWLHARSKPGSHVVIKNDGRPIPEEIVQRAAGLAAYYSIAREDTTVEVDVTERRYVRPIRGGRPGMVTYRNERTLRVRPRRW